jgi:polyisoprenoid-binding protein YceI
MVANTVPYAIDATASLFTVQAFASGLVAVMAHSPKFAIRNFSGTAVFSDPIQDSTLNITIKLRSLELMDDVRTSERAEIERVMFGEVLEADRYPAVDFRSSSVTGTKIMANVYRLQILGNLQMHGNNRITKVESQVMVGDDILKAHGAFSIQQSEFALKIASVAGGNLKLKDELRFTYFVTARRKN